MANVSFQSELEEEMLHCLQYAENSTNISSNPWQYIRCFRGPQTQDIEIAVCVTIMNCVVFVTGLIGNLTVCVVIMKHQTLNSPTDYYLLNLALSDVTLLIFGLPYDVTLYWYQYPWIFGELICQVRALFSEMASYVSVLTVVAFSTERYLAICQPLYTFAISSLQRAQRIITCLWILSFICALPFAIYSGVHHISYPENSDNILPESAFCAMISQPENIPLTEISTIVFFIIPMIIILYQYIKMGIVIQETTRSDESLGRGVSGSVHGRNRKQQLHCKNIIKMLSFVVLGFFACWCPFHAQRLISIHLRDYSYFDELNYWMYITSGIFYYFSSTLNPILYNVMSDRMRNAFMEVICGVRKKKRRHLSSYVTKETSHITISNQPSNANSEDAERIHLVKKEEIVLYARKSESSMFIEIHEYKDKQQYERTETSM